MERKEIEEFTKVIETLSATIKLLNELNEVIKENNRFIRDDAAIFRKIVQDGIDQGAIKFGLPAKKSQ